MLLAKVFSFMGHNLRVIQRDNINWFHAGDVCEMCGVFVGGNRWRGVSNFVPKSECTTMKDLINTLPNEN